GYSSLNYLKKFGFDTLKIDRAFVRDLENDPQSAAITSAIIALGRGLNLSVVAEGVETVEQMNCLRSLNCEEMQGFLFSHPLSAEEASQLLVDNFRSQIANFRLNSICHLK
ncbi:EAL domain-containing protein, partial [Planktothrix sp. FACHB-1355]